MKVSLLFCLIASVAFFELGHCLECYSCPSGTTKKCETKTQCGDFQNSCLKLKSQDVTYTSCLVYSDCDMTVLGQHYPTLSSFTFKCCTGNLCNGPSFMDRVKDFLGLEK